MFQPTQALALACGDNNRHNSQPLWGKGLALALALSSVKLKSIRMNLKQRREVEGDSNCTDTSHHRVAEVEVVLWQKRMKKTTWRQRSWKQHRQPGSRQKLLREKMVKIGSNTSKDGQGQADNWSKVESSPAQSSAKAKMGTPVALLLSTDRCFHYLASFVMMMTSVS